MTAIVILGQFEFDGQEKYVTVQMGIQAEEG
jgi:hypothetical protein